MPFKKGQGGRPRKVKETDPMASNVLDDDSKNLMPEPPWDVDPVVDTVPKRKEIPVFDHNQPVSVSIALNGRFLEQNGYQFTFAEWNREKQRFVPEPRYIPRGLVKQDELMSRLSQYIFKMSELEMSLRNFQEVLLRNLEIMKDGKQD